MDLYIQQSEKQSNLKIELLRQYGLSLGDVFNLNRLAIQAAEMSNQGTSSEVKIGASVMTISGTMYQGTFIEHSSSYSTGISAEDSAIFKANSDGQTQFKAICVHVKHQVKEEDQPIQQQSSGNIFQLIGNPQSLNSPSLISPRLNQQLLSSDMYTVPELQRGNSSQNLYEIMRNTQQSSSQKNGFQAQSQIQLQQQQNQQKRFKSVFQMPNGQWRNSLFISKNQHMLFISCKSEQNFIVKASESVLALASIPSLTQSLNNQFQQQLPMSLQQIHHGQKHPSQNQQIQQQNEKIRQTLDKAASWAQLDFNEETRYQCEKLIISDPKQKLKSMFNQKLTFNEPGVILRKYECGFNRINYVTLQLLAHGISEYLFEKYDRNELANQGVVVGFDSRYESFGLAHMMAAVLKAYQIRVFCLDRYAISTFVSYFSQKFKCILGLFITGRNKSKKYSGIMIFNSQGNLISLEQSKAIEKSTQEYSQNLSYLIDLSPLFDYTAKKVKFKPDNFTDVTMKSYIQVIEEKFLFNQRKINKLSDKIVFSSLHGPAYEFMRKIFANFGFPSLIIPEQHQNMSALFDTVIIPDVNLQQLVLRYSFQCCDQKDSNIIICTDPIGEQIQLAERIKIGEKMIWKIYKASDLAIILIEFSKQSLAQQQGEQKNSIVVVLDQNSLSVQKYCESEKIEVITLAEFKQENYHDRYLIKVNTETSSFQIGSYRGYYDSIITSIVIAQLLVQLQQDDKSLYYDYLMPMLNKIQEQTQEFRLHMQIVQNDQKWFQIFEEMATLYKDKSVKILSQQEIGDIQIMSFKQQKGLEEISIYIIQLELKYNLIMKIYSSKLCQIKVQYEDVENKNDDKKHIKLIKKMMFSIIKAAYNEQQFEILNEQSPQIESQQSNGGGIHLPIKQKVLPLLTFI
ncbi:glucose-bisphosphate synthase [Stylonychia lemnae]|uniref:Glucose-bisphosphate synthase n=1 Tax=Stylonychia lemnae TaxID=5949 RepID=A0A077ZWH5_STYLE|nr:glucose-bisphosphate synthase [Stylonychia lemnae]|eukprot:CDW72796.1 glucose-bisphosphate synthase [Stylonychia lemnae]